MKNAPRVLGRLLQEISWEGNARHYRQGGRGLENVLTAEVFQALDFLPRTEFFGRALKSAVGAGGAIQRLSSEIEGAKLSLLPGDHELARGRPARARSPAVAGSR